MCNRAVTELGMSMAYIGNKLGISVSTVNATVKTGRTILERVGLKSLDLLNVQM